MATPTFAAIVESRRASDSPKRPSCVVLWTLIAPIAVSPTGSARRDTTSPASRSLSTADRVPVGFAVQEERLARDEDPRGEPFAERERLLGCAARRPRGSTGTRSGRSARCAAPHSRCRRRRSAASARRRARSAASRSSWLDRAWPTSLTVASSASRWRVSSIRRTFSRATLRLAASVVNSSTSESLKACSRSMFWREITPRASSPTRSGTQSAESGCSPDVMVGSWPSSRPGPARPGSTSSGLRVSITRRRGPMIGERLLREPDAALDRVEEPDLVLLGSTTADVDDLGVEDRLDAVTDEVVHRLPVELLGKAVLDVVDQGQLGGPLVRLGQQPLRLVEQAGVLEGDAEAAARVRQQRGRRTR